MGKINIDKKKNENIGLQENINLNKEKKAKFPLIPFLCMLIYIAFMFWSRENLSIYFVVAEFFFFFFCIGVAMFFNGSRKGSFIFMGLSGLAIIFVLAIPYIPEDIKNFFLIKVTPKLFSLLFVFLGFLITVIPLIIQNKKKNRCTVPVESVIIRVNSKISVDNDGHRRTVYSPVYAFTYNGKRIEYCSKIYSNIEKNIVGDNKTLYINPNDENDIYIEMNIKTCIILAFIGIAFVGFGIYAFFLF